MQTPDDLAASIAAERAATQSLLTTLSDDLAGMIEASRSTNADDEHDPEGATIAFERAQVVTLIEQSEQRLTELTEAERRLAEGRYGSCERCGEPIAVERLLARPAARFCVRCATRH